MFPLSGPNCIQTAYTVHTNCIQTTVCEGIVNTSMATTDATPNTVTPAKKQNGGQKPLKKSMAATTGPNPTRVDAYRSPDSKNIKPGKDPQ